MLCSLVLLELKRGLWRRGCTLFEPDFELEVFADRLKVWHTFA